MILQCTEVSKMARGYPSRSCKNVKPKKTCGHSLSRQWSGVENLLKGNSLGSLLRIATCQLCDLGQVLYNDLCVPQFLYKVGMIIALTVSPSGGRVIRKANILVIESTTC